MFRYRSSLRTLSPSLFLFVSFLFLVGAPGEVSAQDPPEVAEQELIPAEKALAAALTQAEKDGRLVFLHTGADW